MINTRSQSRMVGNAADYTTGFQSYLTTSTLTSYKAYLFVSSFNPPKNNLQLTPTNSTHDITRSNQFTHHLTSPTCPAPTTSSPSKRTTSVVRIHQVTRTQLNIRIFLQIGLERYLLTRQYLSSRPGMPLRSSPAHIPGQHMP